MTPWPARGKQHNGAFWSGTLGTQIGLGWGRQNERDLMMVEDPPTCNTTDLEEVVGGTLVPRVDPKTLREISGRFFQFAVP